MSTIMEYTIQHKPEAGRWNILMQFLQRKLRGWIKTYQAVHGEEQMLEAKEILLAARASRKTSRQRWLYECRRTMNSVPPRVWKRHSALLLMMSSRSEAASKTGARKSLMH